MARTKQTARRSTGGQAPRRPIYHRRAWHNLTYEQLPLQQHIALINATILDTAVASDAQREVLSAPDLLLLILSQLPHSSLLKAKLVNKTWASLFKHVEIQAALFERPRPKESALYAETYSDLLMDNFSAFWSIYRDESDQAVLPESSIVTQPHPKESNEGPVDVPNVHRPSKNSSQKRMTVRLRIQKYTDKCLSWQWRQLLLFQPAVEVLELVQHVSQRSSGTIEFRAIVPRPNGLRMGFLYDAVRYWHEVEKSSVKLLWQRKTGDLVDPVYYYKDGTSYKTVEDKPCITIWGKTSVGCGQYGGLTYANYIPTRSGEQAQRSRARIMKSGDEEVEFFMSAPKDIDVDLELFFASRKADEEEEEDEEDENLVDETV